MKKTLQQSLALSLAASLAAVPYFLFLTSAFPDGGYPSAFMDPRRLILHQTLILFFICSICCVTGLSLARRYNLPGLGALRDIRTVLPALLVGGASFIVVSYLVHDRFLLVVSPASYPDSLLLAALLPFKKALTEEVILRLGFLTFCMGLFKNKIAAVTSSSLIAVLFSLPYVDFIGLRVTADYIIVSGMLLTFVTNLVLGWLFVTRGLTSSMTFGFIVGLKYIPIAVMS